MPRIRLAFGICLSSLLLIACTPHQTEVGLRGALTGIGSDSMQKAVSAWTLGWQKQNPSASITYSPDGAATGLDALFSGEAYFAEATGPLSGADLARSKPSCGADGAFSVPSTVLPIGVAYKLDGVKTLKLDASILTKIFLGKVTMWNDPGIVAQNPQVDLPAIKITPVHLSKPSDTTDAFNDYLSKNTSEKWTNGSSTTWPSETVGGSEDSPIGVANKLDDTKGGIAVIDRSTIGSRFSVAALKFGNVYQSFSDDSTIAAARNGKVSSDENGVVQTLNGASGYSLAIVGYQVFCSSYQVSQVSDLVRSWALYGLSDAGQRDANIYTAALSPSDAALSKSRDLIQKIKSKV